MSKPITMPDEPEHGGCGREQPRRRGVEFPDERPVRVPGVDEPITEPIEVPNWPIKVPVEV